MITTQIQQTLSWPEIIITAEGLKEDFVEVTIKTLKQSFIENVYDYVWTQTQDHDMSISEIDAEVERLIRQEKTYPISEYILI